MSQNITLMGASYSDVPAVTLPKTGGGTASFTDVTDTTAAASDVASGKYFYTSAGVRTQGTNSGGGGASNVVCGTFTASSTTGSAATFDTGYTGNGYPISVLIYIDGGCYNNTSTGDTEWYNSLQRYAVGLWGCVKSNTTTSPTYATSGAQNQCTTFGIYKNSTTAATTYSRTSAMSTVVLTSSSTNASNTVANTIKFKGNNHTISYFVASTSYGLLAGSKYAYEIIYSS